MPWILLAAVGFLGMRRDLCVGYMPYSLLELLCAGWQIKKHGLPRCGSNDAAGAKRRDVGVPHMQNFPQNLVCLLT